MKILSKLWMALGKSPRGLIRVAIRHEVHLVVVDEVAPFIAEMINEKLPGVGTVIANELGDRFGIQPEIALHKGEMAIGSELLDWLNSDPKIARVKKVENLITNFPNKEVK